MQENANLASMKADLAAANEAAVAYIKLLEPLEEELEAAVNKLHEEFKQRHAELLANSVLAAQNAKRLETSLRDSIVAIYLGKIEAAKILGQDHKAVEKSFGDGLSVRVTRKFEYSQDDAVEWAAANAPFLIVATVDAKQFEAEMKGLKKLPPFVAVNESVAAVISFK